MLCRGEIGAWTTNAAVRTAPPVVATQHHGAVAVSSLTPPGMCVHVCECFLYLCVCVRVCECFYICVCAFACVCLIRRHLLLTHSTMVPWPSARSHHHSLQLAHATRYVRTFEQVYFCACVCLCACLHEFVCLAWVHTPPLVVPHALVAVSSLRKCICVRACDCV